MKPVFRQPSFMSWVAATVLLAAALCCFLLPVYWVRQQLTTGMGSPAGKSALLDDRAPGVLLVGDRVRHREGFYGAGTVVSVEPQLIEVQFDGGDRMVFERRQVAGQLELASPSGPAFLREWFQIVARQVSDALSRGVRAMMRDTVRVFRQTADDGRHAAERAISR